MAFHVPETYRLTYGPAASDQGYGNNGAFMLPAKIADRQIFVIASDGLGWEHCSVRIGAGKKSMIPTWVEMCHVKELFWDPEDTVAQFHPRQSEYVNFHPHVLHLWRPVGREILLPPGILVGPRM